MYVTYEFILPLFGILYQRTYESIFMYEFIWWPFVQPINRHKNSYQCMNLYYGRSYNLSANLSMDIWICTSIWILMSVVTKPICSCQDENTNLHVHLNSYVTNNKFPKNNIKIICLIKFFLQNPTTSMRNWVCSHKS